MAELLARDGIGRAWRVAALLAGPLIVLLGILAVPALANPSPYLSGDEALVAHYLHVESQLLGVTPNFSVSVTENTRPGYAALTDLSDAGGQRVGAETRCEIEIERAAHTSGQVPETAAHEAFHCLAGQLSGTLANFESHGNWLIEGSAGWVESALIAHDRSAQGYWMDYLLSPTTPLFDRMGLRDPPYWAYSAIGFFGHLAASGISPWQVFGRMFLATSGPAAYGASGADSDRFLSTEAAAFFDAPQVGSAWTTGNQGSAIANGNVPVHRPKPQWPKVSVALSATKSIVVKPYTDRPLTLVMKAPVLTVSAGAPNRPYAQVRVGSTKGPHLDTVVTGSRPLILCKTQQACASCPGAKKFKGGDLAIAGGPTGETVKLVGDCLLPPRSCAGLLPLSTFPSVGGEEPAYPPGSSMGGVDIGGYGVVTEGAYGFGSSSSECSVTQIPPADSSQTNPPGTTGFTLLISWATTKRAKNYYGNGTGTPTLFSDPTNPFMLSPFTRLAIGDAAVTYTFRNADQGDSGSVSTGVGGSVRVANDTYFFSCISAGDVCPDASSVLSQVANELR